MTPGVPETKKRAPPLMARVGRRYFANRSTKVKALASGDALHVLNEAERARLRRVQWGAVARAALAGALSGAVCAAAEFYADAHFEGNAIVYWSVVGGATVVAATLEIAFIYWDTLRSVHELARVAGIELFGPDRESSDDALVDSLARAALELPNPVDVGVGVNPHREVKKWRLVVASLAYKAKVGVTNFVVKLLIRRVASRAALRGLLPLVGIPVTAFWNGVVTWLVLKEARIRALGPSAVEEMVKEIFSDAPRMSDAGRLSAVRAVAAAIVRTRDLHPNLVRLLSVVSRYAGDTGKNELDDVGLFLETLKSLEAGERRVSLQLLAVACIIDGRLSDRERLLWKDSLVASGQAVAFEQLEALRLAFVRGDEGTEKTLRAI